MVALVLPHLMRRFGLNSPVQILPLAAPPSDRAEIYVAGFSALLYCAILGHYTHRKPFWAETRDILVVSFLALLIASLADVVFRGSPPRQLVLGIWVLFAPAVVCGRMVAKYLLARFNLWQRDIILIGDAARLAEARDALLSDNSLGYRVVGMVDQTALDESLKRGTFRNLLRAYGATRLVLAIDAGSTAGQRVARAVLRDRVPFSLVPRTAGLPILDFERVAFFSHDMVLLNYRNNLANPFARAIKTCLDLSLSIIMLALLGLPMLLIAALIRRDGGPALFRHERVGVDGRRFQCLKFRTMVVNADQVLHDVLANDPRAAAEWREQRKLSHDPRITPLGRLLRMTSLDELPQLLNVLRLEMSLVGPRPIVHQEVPKYGERIADYVQTRPGLTGLWQVSGRSDTSYDHRVELDSWYVRNWTAWHDIAILFKTVPAVLARKGAR
jgi:undecaprenyl-phosphate galactose phosphotransferase